MAILVFKTNGVPPYLDQVGLRFLVFRKDICYYQWGPSNKFLHSSAEGGMTRRPVITFFLFIIVMGALNVVICRVCNMQLPLVYNYLIKGNFYLIYYKRMMSYSWSFSNYKNIYRILLSFYLASDPKTNYSKSKILIWCWGWPKYPITSAKMAQLLHFQEGALPFKYLGIRSLGTNMNLGKHGNWQLWSKLTNLEGIHSLVERY